MPAVVSAGHRRAVFHPLTVAGVQPLTDDSVVLTFAVPAELREDYRFLPGQHLALRCELDGAEVRRTYSICSPASGAPLRVAVKRLPGGAFSAYAHDRLVAGDRLDVMTPTGTFTVPIDPTHAKHYAAVAAGSGITPVLSILATVLAEEPGSRCTLLYGNRSTSSVMFLEELADLKDRYPTRLQLVHVLSREQPEVELLAGRLDRVKLPLLLDALVEPTTVDEWLLCGPFEMVQDARAVLSSAGVDPARVHFELFHVGDEPPRPAATAVADDGSECDVTVVLDGRASTFPMERRGERILDVALRWRPDAPYSCRSGVCGTCRARLREGRVEMVRNFALEADEIAAGVVLACQAQPDSERVVLDFDG
ncbi:MAG: phenylacetate-CoA oxygenase/reductase subunit PaaK [Actinobacteria bacterium]|nr:phenylacetate-CoA oxygenase/reductase subunit PaaK [Actinomycetota bacterium]MBI3687281.1 phenylacetate-CoA oxygenase/reductase subunit PaaK [Actinomycetota bacterium]